MKNTRDRESRLYEELNNYRLRPVGSDNNLRKGKATTENTENTKKNTKGHVFVLSDIPIPGSIITCSVISVSSVVFLCGCPETASNYVSVTGLR